MASSYKNLSADTLVKTGAGKLVGIFVASASGSPAIKIWDNVDGTAPILVNTFTPVAATYYEFPDVVFTRGLFVDITNTVDATVFYE
jgi:hypothetical protein